MTPATIDAPKVEKDEAAYRVKRQPFKALGIAVGVGLVLGVAVGWIGARFGKAKFTCDD
jgi:ElaB/YqjD/DUF883 family membrane-anchored ribosome-binding protein